MGKKRRAAMEATALEKAPPQKFHGQGVPEQMLRNIADQIQHHDRKDPHQSPNAACPDCDGRGRYLAVNGLTWTDWGFPERILERKVVESDDTPEGDAFDVVCGCRISRLMDE